MIVYPPTRAPAEAWRTRFVGPHRCKHGLWWVWDRLTCRGVGPYRTRAEARADVRKARESFAPSSDEGQSAGLAGERRNA